MKNNDDYKRINNEIDAEAHEICLRRYNIHYADIGVCGDVEAEFRTEKKTLKNTISLIDRY